MENNNIDNEHNLNDNLANNHSKNDTTRIIKLQKRNEHRVDKISGTILALIIIFITIISVGRITVIGQFLDDLFFNFLFGWFKYIVYLFIFTIAFGIFFGVKIKVKKRVRWMALLLILLICWFVNDLVLLISREYAAHSIKLNWFIETIKNYSVNWWDNVIFSRPFNLQTFFGINGSYFIRYAGGGIIGTLFSAFFGYLTTYVSFIFSIISLTLTISWIVTGNFLFLFNYKRNKKSKGLQIIHLSSNNSKTQTNKIHHKLFKNNFHKISADLKYNDRQILHQTKESDITIEMPTFSAYKKEDLLFDDIFEGNNENLQTEELLAPTPPPMPNYQPPYYNQQTQSINTPLAYEKPESEYKYDYQPRKKNTYQPPKEYIAQDPYLTPFGREKSKVVFPQESNYSHLNNQNNNKLLNQDGGLLVNDYNQNQEPYEYNYNNYPELNQNRNHRFVSPNLSQRVESKKSKINPNYQLPPLQLLHEKPINTNHNQNIIAAKQNALKVDNLFKQFNVEAKVVNINIGPSVTKFEVELQLGTKVNKIINLENDIKLTLASREIRIEAPIQGKSAVGIEIPNLFPTLVTLKEVIEHVPGDKKQNKLLVAIGKNVMGKLLFAELNRMPHLLIAGSTGSGKSICINTIICSLILRTKPYEVKLLLIDPKRVELSTYQTLPHLLAPVITDPKKANQALKQIISEMERRYTIFAEAGVKNIDSYNLKVSLQKRVPYYVVIIDELADLMVVAGKEVEESIMRITQMARAAGIHLILATQRPSTDIITGVIKTNIPSRIAFAVSSSIDSRTILDSMGAEKLIGRGDMLFAPTGQLLPIRAQGAYISDEEIHNLITFVNGQEQPQFAEEFLQNEEQQVRSSGVVSGEDDQLYQEVKAFVIQSQKASASLLQRRFGLGYNRAARLIDSLEANGIIGPQQGSKSRQVLVQDYYNNY